MNAVQRHLSKHHGHWFWAILAVALLIRVPLLFNHFIHCDDKPTAITYPPFQHVIAFTESKLDTAVNRYTTWPRHLVSRTYTRSFGVVLSLLGIVTSRMVLLQLFPTRPLLALGLPIIACMAQMHIIYSVHSGPYGQMLLCYNGIILCFLYCLRKPLSLGEAFIVAVVLSLTVQLGFTSIFLFPAFFGGLLLSREVRGRPGFWKPFLVMLGATGCHLVYVIALFLWNIRDSGNNWNVGANNEFSFHFDGIANAAGVILGNLAVMIENHLAPYSAIEFSSIGSARLLLGCATLPPFALGLWWLFRERRAVFWFSVIFLGTVVAFGCRNTMPMLCPTRHTLGYVAILLVVYAATVEWAGRFGPRWPDRLALGLGSMALVCCLAGLPGFYAARTNKLSTAHVQRVVKEHRVDFVLHYDYTSSVLHYPGVRRKRIYRRLDELLETANRLPPRDITILLVSHRRQPRSLEIEYPQYAALWTNASIAFCEYVDSDTEVGRSSWNPNGTNGRYLTVVTVPQG